MTPKEAGERYARAQSLCKNGANLLVRMLNEDEWDNATKVAEILHTKLKALQGIREALRAQGEELQVRDPRHEPHM